MKKKYFHLAVMAMMASVAAFAQQRQQPETSDATLAPVLQMPRSYTILKTSQPINIDGKNDEQVWEKAPWSEPMVDIAGNPDVKPPHDTRFKLLWDDEYLYVYSRFHEQHIWANLKEHDQSIFQDNALEMFIDPDGDTHAYMEFQINAHNAVWDLLLARPPRNGGPSITDWDIKGLKKAVHIEGTLNNPSDVDNYWGIEFAIPLRTFRYSGNAAMPKAGSIWRLNVTRVQREVDIKDGAYVRRNGPNGRPMQPAYTSWTPQGIVNFHMPERWGFARFAGENDSPGKFVNEDLERSKLILWKYFYLQQEFRQKNGKYATSIDQLKTQFPAVSFSDSANIRLVATDFHYTMQLDNPAQKLTITLEHDSRLQVRPMD